MTTLHPAQQHHLTTIGIHRGCGSGTGAGRVWLLEAGFAGWMMVRRPDPGRSEVLVSAGRERRAWGSVDECEYLVAAG
ncbi:hypothetical protein SAMN06272735_8608 [Streptomyces sp. TLI_55]|nr:hypothetical protein SAMN06272735_8608 [Streptomyces sp. TLI_55]